MYFIEDDVKNGPLNLALVIGGIVDLLIDVLLFVSQKVIFVTILLD